MFNLKNVKTLSSAVLLSLAAATPALAADTQSGTITFTGTIYNSTCKININGVDRDSANVNMGRHGTSEFGDEAGTEVKGGGDNGLVSFGLTECPDQGTLTITLTGETVQGSSSIFKLANNSEAKGLGIRIYPEGKSGNEHDAIWNNEKITLDVVDAEGFSVKYRAYYVSTDKKVTAGSANSAVNYNITYD